MKTYLDNILIAKAQEVKLKKEIKSVQELKKGGYMQTACNSLFDALQNKTDAAIIAEFKRKSPSKGIINDKAPILKTLKGYQDSGAAAVSVLSDYDFFSGSLADVHAAKQTLSIPVLRKDFIIDPYQVFESKCIGADAILLISRILSQDQLKEYGKLATELGLEVLYEVHSQEDIDKLPHFAQIIGINNRNLKSFEVDFGHSQRLCSALPTQSFKIAESGIKSGLDMRTLKNAGFNGFLIGEGFMKTNNPAEALKVMLEDYTQASAKLNTQVYDY